MNSRNLLMDGLKGFAILLVVLGHAVQYNVGEDYNNNILFRIIYSFHMPLFMFVSGFLSFGTFDGSIPKLSKRFKTLIIPFFTWFFFGYIYTFILNRFTHQTQDNLWHDFIALLKSPDHGLWFLWVLFLNAMVLFVALRISKKYEELVLLFIWGALQIFVRVTNIKTGGIDLLSWHLFFFSFGYCLHKYQDRLRAVLRVAGICSWLIFPILVSFWYKNGDPSFASDLDALGKLKTLILFSYAWLTPISGILFCYSLMERLMRFDFYGKPQLLFLSHITMEIYAVHFYLLNFVVLFLLWPLALSIPITIAIALIGSIGIQGLMKKSEVLSFLFFGKESKSKSVEHLPASTN